MTSAFFNLTTEQLVAAPLSGSIFALNVRTQGLPDPVFAADCLMLARRYTLLDRSAGERLLPECESRGIAVIWLLRSILASLRQERVGMRPITTSRPHGAGSQN